MEVEVRGMAPATRRQLGSKVRDYRKLLDGIQADIDGAKSKADRESLMRGSRGAATYGSDAGMHLTEASRDRRAQMEAATTRSAQSTATLHGAVQTLAETHASADATLDALASNRETLVRTRDRLGELNSNVGFARSVLSSMQNREFRFKACIAFFGLVLIAVIGVVIYLAFGDKQQ
jgi:vesicle transport through interaction with t-SNAREs 1